MKKITFFSIGCFFAIGTMSTKAQDIFTVVGNGTIGYYGDGGQATAAELYSPSSVTFDKAGNYYIADEQNNVVRKVTISSGVISTVAGNGYSFGGYYGDGGQATAAELDWTISVAFDSVGNLYVTDRTNEVIRMVTKSTGIISTVAGNYSLGLGYNGDGIQATAAQLDQPDYIAISAANNLYIADFNNNRIREVNLKTGIISTVVGNGSAGYSGDGGSATAAELNSPYGVTFDNVGNMYIGDQGNYCVREVNTSGIISTIAGIGTVTGFSGDGGPATAAKMSGITGITVGSTGNVYIADTPNNRIRKVDKTSGIITTIVGSGTSGYSGDGGPATAAEIHFPNGATLDAFGTLYFPDWANARIRKIVNQDQEGIKNVSYSKDITIYPNPAKNQLFVDLGNASDGKTIFTFYNILGQEITSQASSDLQIVNLNISGVHSGIYLLRVQFEDGSSTTRKIEISK